MADGFAAMGKREPIVDSIVLDAEEAKFPSWYEVPTTKVRNEPGESSMRWIGMTPHAPWTQNCSKKAAAITALDEVNV